jgi:N6-adenosine-specific RNA methylase IME4
MYRTIVADPPWPYPEGYVVSLPSGRDMKVVPGKPASRALKYPTLPLVDIASLPVARLADIDCRLFLWTTNKWLPDAFTVLEAWDFRYRQTLVWSKRKGGPYVHSVAPNTAEFLLVAVRGKPTRTGKFPATVLSIPAHRNHSRKPEAWQDWIEQVSPGPYLELFARRQRLGWDAWGDEVASSPLVSAVFGSPPSPQSETNA